MLKEGRRYSSCLGTISLHNAQPLRLLHHRACKTFTDISIYVYYMYMNLGITVHVYVHVYWHLSF